MVLLSGERRRQIYIKELRLISAPAQAEAARRDAKNDERVLLAGFDSVNNDVRQSGDAHFARSRQRSFMADMRERGQEIDRLSNSRADTPGSIGISLRDVFSNGIEMPTCPPCKPQPQRPNFCQVSATSFSEANS
jgi:hypothetical protein